MITLLSIKYQYNVLVKHAAHAGMCLLMRGNARDSIHSVQQATNLQYLRQVEKRLVVQVRSRRARYVRDLVSAVHITRGGQPMMQHRELP